MSDLERALAAEAQLRELEDKRKAAEARAKAEEDKRKAAEAHAKAEEDKRKTAEKELEDYHREHDVMWGYTSATPSSVDSVSKLKKGRIESGTEVGVVKGLPEEPPEIHYTRAGRAGLHHPVPVLM